MPAKHRPSARLIRNSEELVAIAERLSWSLPSPLDAAPLVRRAVYQLFAAVLLLDGHEASSATACREKILSSDDYRQLFAGVVDELALLDELSGSFELVGHASPAQIDKLTGLMKRLQPVSRRVRQRFDAKLRADGARPRPTGALWLLGLGAVGAIAGALLYRSWSPGQGAAGDPSASGGPSPGTATAAAVQAPAGRCFEATFFSDPEFRKAVHNRRDCQIAFDWGEGSVPDVPSLPADAFSVRWEGILKPPRTEAYRFQLTSDDGSRLYLNDVVVLDNWGAHNPEERASDPIELTAGADVPIVVEYYDVSELALVKLTWSSPSMPQQPLSGQYVVPRRGQHAAGSVATADAVAFGPNDCFLGRYFRGRGLEQLVRERRDCRIAFDWGMGPPTEIDGLPEDEFSVRWEGTLRVPATDEYVFYLASDDGSRLLLDGEKIVGEYNEHGFDFLESEPIKLTQGTDYPIVVEFFEAKELATIRLEWASPTLAREPLSGRYVSAPTGKASADETPSRRRPKSP